MKTQQIIAKTCLATIVCLALTTIIAAPWIMEKTSPEMGIYTGAIAGFTLLMLLLDLKTVRFLKGLILIGYGVLFQVIYTKYYFLFPDTDTTRTEELKIQLDLYMQILVFACAGAGGSIIANYADKSSIDYEKPSSDHSLTDNTENFKKLNASIKKIERKADLIMKISLMSVATILVIAVTILFKL
ncbi:MULTISPECIES: hypothetical protein [unclassified Pseudomonas]|uniref:hypothetical protein n=1 Tax=unclassified Pseudomonas TaxID=196821 RepID=UPI000A1EC0BF|nr:MULTISPECIES: hypothetical protein [unclassified Pseudomonas]